MEPSSVYREAPSYQYIKILTVCLSVCVCVTEAGCLWGGTRLVTCDLRTIEPQTLRRMFENIGHGLAGSF